jgi:hypothetical protein
MGGPRIRAQEAASERAVATLQLKSDFRVIRYPQLAKYLSQGCRSHLGQAKIGELI